MGRTPVKRVLEAQSDRAGGTQRKRLEEFFILPPPANVLPEVVAVRARTGKACLGTYRRPGVAFTNTRRGKAIWSPSTKATQSSA